MQEKKSIAQENLHEIIRRIVEVAQPEKIILFGSAARGEMGPHSDVDLLVIKSGAHRLELTGQIYRHMHGVGEAVDILVVTKSAEKPRHSCRGWIGVGRAGLNAQEPNNTYAVPEPSMGEGTA